jgi:RHS repeat-associated protein
LLPLPLGEGGGEGGALADENSAGSVSWLLSDNLGTIRDVAQYNSGTNTTTIVDHLKYDSFGNITSQTSSANQPLFAFTGQLFDKDTGLQYNSARWYDPHLGRFISQDPSGFAAGDPNLYRYVTNSPANFIDPTGLEAESAAGGVVASGRTGPDANGWWQYGNFYPEVIGPGASLADGSDGYFGENSDSVLGATIGGLLRGIGGTFMSGEAYDSAKGAMDSMARFWSFGYVETNGPRFGYDGAFANGQAIGATAVFVQSVLATIYGAARIATALTAGTLFTVARGGAGLLFAGAGGQVVGGTGYIVLANGAVIVRAASGAVILVGGAINAGRSFGTVYMGYGSYTNTHASGKTYSGKGDKGRMNDSAAEKEDMHDDPVVSQDHTPAVDDKQSFIDEQGRIEANGGPGGNTYNKYNSPGKKLRGVP